MEVIFLFKVTPLHCSVSLEIKESSRVRLHVFFFFGRNRITTGEALRNHLGAIVLSSWKKIFGAGSAEEVEAQACREGLTLAAEWTSGPIILESDCAAVVSYLVNPTSQRSASYFVIREALEVAGRVPGVEFRHTGRACNRLAHELAQLAKRLNHSAVWRERCPTSVEHLAAQDVNT